MHCAPLKKNEKRLDTNVIVSCQTISDILKRDGENDNSNDNDVH